MRDIESKILRQLKCAFVLATSTTFCHLPVSHAQTYVLFVPLLSQAGHQVDTKANVNFWDSELPVKTVSCVEPLGTALLENAVDPPTARSKFEPDVTWGI